MFENSEQPRKNHNRVGGAEGEASTNRCGDSGKKTAAASNRQNGAITISTSKAKRPRGRRAGGSGRVAWNGERAERVIKFIETLIVPNGYGAGKPFKLREWQKQEIYNIYSPTRANGLRAVREAVLSVPRKNGKTAFIAALVLVHLIGPEAKLNSSIYSAANDTEQAALIFRVCEQFIAAHPVLRRLLKCIASTKRIVCYKTGSFYKSVSAEAKTKHGMNPTVCIYDELAQARDRELYDVLKTSFGAQEEPLMIVISTQADNDNHVLSQLIDYGLQVQQGALPADPSFYLSLYTTPIDADIYDQKNWYLSNPALGDFRSFEEMEIMAKRARDMPSSEPAFRNLYLNQRYMADESMFVTQRVWDLGKPKPDIEALKGKKCFGGLDLSAGGDLTAFVLSFPQDDGSFDIVPTFWLPKEGLAEKARRDRAPYVDWVAAGFMKTTHGSTIDYRTIAEYLAAVRTIYDIQAIAYDRWRIDDLRKQLEEIGVSVVIGEEETKQRDALRLIPFGQGFRDMSPAVDATERVLLEGKARHAGHPVLTWNAWNARVVMDPAGNRKIDKQKSKNKIDGIVAMAMGLGLASRLIQQTQQPSVYEKRGVLIL